MSQTKYSLVIHGGAGTILRQEMSAEMEALYREGLHLALNAGDAILSAGGSALDAVEAAVIALENNPLFNAGKGAVFTHEGQHELDASIMCGRTLNAGAVAGVQGVKNPVILARTVMERSEHVLLCGQGAGEFAREQGLVFENPDYFFTEFRYHQLQQAKAENTVQLDHSSSKKFGTVGAVALDIHGNLAAATSTGGMTNKRYGRVGDTPVIGAGTYANNATCAVSCTGHGEYFLRSVVAYDVSCLMEYRGYNLQQACDEVVMHKLAERGGEGGLIATDALGNVALVFNSAGMYRGLKRSGEAAEVMIYR